MLCCFGSALPAGSPVHTPSASKATTPKGTSAASGPTLASADIIQQTLVPSPGTVQQAPDQPRPHPAGHATSIQSEHLASTGTCELHSTKETIATAQMPGLEEQALLEDLKLVEVLGTGGFATTYGGSWRQGVKVAVKLFLTSSQPNASPCSSTQSQSLHRALAEANLSKALAHPNIVYTYNVRCCALSLPFLAAVYYGSENITPMVLLEGICLLSRVDAARGVQMRRDEQCLSIEDMWDSLEVAPQRHWLMAGTSQDPFFTNAQLTKDELILAAEQALQLIRDWQGATPLHPAPGRPGRSTFDGKSDDHESFSQDGFGSPDDSRPALSWLEVLGKLGAKPGDYMTCIVMRNCDLGTLEAAVLRGVFHCDDQATVRDKRRRFRALLRSLREIAQALEYLHGSKVIHGDLKPSNALLAGSRIDVRGFSVLVADFGLSKIISSPNGQSTMGTGRGTVQYMAPEQLKTGRISMKADIYSLGITMWALATRRMPYQGLDQVEIVRGVQSGVLWPVWPPEVYDELEPLFKRCIAYEPQVRPTASEVVRDLILLELEVRQTHRVRSSPACTLQTAPIAPAPLDALRTSRSCAAPTHAHPSGSSNADAARTTSPQDSTHPAASVPMAPVAAAPDMTSALLAQLNLHSPETCISRPAGVHPTVHAPPWQQRRHSAQPGAEVSVTMMVSAPDQIILTDAFSSDDPVISKSEEAPTVSNEYPVADERQSVAAAYL